MIKCSNCGAEIEDGSKFCGECGTAIPQSKECPQCHTKLAFGAKFCMECGYSFTNKQAGGVSIGDKNVIAGDVVGKKDTYHVAGNATIVKNEDESKKLVQCSICGKNMAVSDSIKCKSCGKIVCEDCFDDEAGICAKCVKEGCDAASQEYRESVARIAKNGRISIDDRKKLIALQKKLMINASRAMMIEAQVRPQAGAGVLTENVKAFDKANREKAFDLFYNKGDYKKTVEVLAPFFTANTDDEDLIAMYVGALSKHNPPAARRVVASLKADVLPAYMVLFEMDLKNGDLAAAEKRLDKANEFWPNNLIVACHRAMFLCEMAKISDDKSLIAMAKSALTDVPEATTSIEKSWLAYANNIVKCAEGEAPNVDWPTVCKTDGLLLDIVSQGEDKSNSMYCIVDISYGEKAKKFPVYYMNTESTTDWDDEFKTCLVPFRRIESGTYKMGHGVPYLPSIDENSYDYNPGDRDRTACPEHMVTLTSAYYIAVFPLTIGQLELIAGDKIKTEDDDEEESVKSESNPMMPVSNLSYVYIRGAKKGLKWPQNDSVDSNSLVAIFREKSGLSSIDLPTEAQWEVACRAGFDSDLYTGVNYGADSGKNKLLLDELAVWGDDVKQQTVGSRIPNRWGLYDMLGNVDEWCLDPDFGHRSDARNRMHTYNFAAVDPTGCLTTLLPEDELERKERVVRGGYYWNDDPEDITVWHRASKDPDCSYSSGAGVRLTIHNGSLLVDELMACADKEFPTLDEKQLMQLRQQAFRGSRKAEYLLIRDEETREGVKSGSLEPLVKKYKLLADFGLPAAMRALGRMLTLSTDTALRREGLGYYRSAIKLGDLQALGQYKVLNACDERLGSIVRSVCEKNAAAFGGDDDRAFFYGKEIAKEEQHIKEIIARDFAWPETLMSDKLFAALIWNTEYMDKLGKANLEAISESGIYIVHGDVNHIHAGFIPWLDFREFGKVGLVGKAKKDVYLQLCEGSIIMEVLRRPNKGKDDPHADGLMSIYGTLHDAVKVLYSDVGLIQKPDVGHLESLDASGFNKLLAATNNFDPVLSYDVAKCYINGWGVEKSRIKAFPYLRNASAAGSIEASKELRRYIANDVYVLPMLKSAIRRGSSVFAENAKYFRYGARLDDSVRKHFEMRYKKSRFDFDGEKSQN